MILFDKTKDATYDNGFKHFFGRGSNEMFVASIIKISTFNKDVLDSDKLCTQVGLHLTTEKNVCIVYDQS